MGDVRESGWGNSSGGARREASGSGNRALFSVMLYSFARVSAVLGMPSSPPAARPAAPLPGWWPLAPGGRARRDGRADDEVPEASGAASGANNAASAASRVQEDRTVPRATDIEYSVALGDDHDRGIAADRSPQVRFALRQGEQGRPLPAGPAALGSPFLAPRRPLPRLAPPDGGRLLLWRRIDFGAETGSRLLQVQQGEGQPPV